MHSYGILATFLLSTRYYLQENKKKDGKTMYSTKALETDGPIHVRTKPFNGIRGRI